MIAASFVSAAAFALQDPACFALIGRPTQIFPMAPVMAIVCFGCGWMQWRVARPRACPTCRRRAMIPIAHPPRPRSRRPVNDGKLGWCTACGATGIREKPGEWSAAPASVA